MSTDFRPIQLQLITCVAAVAAISGWPIPGQARVTRMVLDKVTSPNFEGESFGAAGDYEKITGHLMGEVDPTQADHSWAVPLPNVPPLTEPDHRQPGLEEVVFEAPNLRLPLAAQPKACVVGRGPSAAYAQARPGHTFGSALANTAAFDKRDWFPERSRRAVYRLQGERVKVQNAQTHVDVRPRRSKPVHPLRIFI